ncbi:unnamed protein product, partial [Pylaiella littoralis]
MSPPSSTQSGKKQQRKEGKARGKNNPSESESESSHVRLFGANDTQSCSSKVAAQPPRSPPPPPMTSSPGNASERAAKAAEARVQQAQRMKVVRAAAAAAAAAAAEASVPEHARRGTSRSSSNGGGSRGGGGLLSPERRHFSNGGDGFSNSGDGGGISSPRRRRSGNSGRGRSRGGSACSYPGGRHCGNSGSDGGSGDQYLWEAGVDQIAPGGRNGGRHHRGGGEARGGGANARGGACSSGFGRSGQGHGCASGKGRWSDLEQGREGRGGGERGRAGYWYGEEDVVRRKDGVVLFWKEPACFVQWTPCRFEVDGEMYCNAEQWMMASKAKRFKDFEARRRIMDTRDPREQKALGRSVRGFDAAVWDEEGYDVVVKGNLEKFRQNPRFRDELLATGDSILAEASPYDFEWGIGLHAADPDALVQSRWPGKNKLGEALMEVRSRLRNGDRPSDEEEE